MRTYHQEIMVLTPSFSFLPQSSSYDKDESLIYKRVLVGRTCVQRIRSHRKEWFGPAGRLPALPASNVSLSRWQAGPSAALTTSIHNFV